MGVMSRREALEAELLEQTDDDGLGGGAFAVAGGFTAGEGHGDSNGDERECEFHSRAEDRENAAREKENGQKRRRGR